MKPFYTQENVFYLPEESRWKYIIENAKQDDIALKIDTALYTIERLMKNVCCGLSSRAIAKQEGVYYSSVDKSIAAAKKNFIKFYENL